ncbi:MAG: glycine cleavage system aminomethyltransferase GcvT [Phycisphaerales bacterium]|nr:glycine cleavage system aminomethyltransferase GcvT [Planctomycetota bacterium]MBL6997334.1 glycine cleavage system aminomethyltransferase GcvT [Phycisphaerales bacterium]
MTNTQELFTSPFHSYHLNKGAKMVDFAGWSLPLHYGSIIEEHTQVRTSGGFFDVSHMGRLRFKGRDACKLLDRLCTRQIYGMSEGQIRYSLICNEAGGCRDDVLVYQEGDSSYMMVCNGANREKIWDHIESNRGDFVCKVKDETESTAMVALQGPKVMELLSNFSSSIPDLKRYRFITKNVFIAKIKISRTGYTGEDGVEVILPKGLAQKALDMMLTHVEDTNSIKPAGLGARDSLRLEAGMPLYGHELDEETDPLSAGLSFAVKLEKGIGDNEAEPFIGQEAIRHIAEHGSGKKLVGVRLDGRRSPRQGMDVCTNGAVIGKITSGCFSPTLNYPIGMAYVASDFDGEIVDIDFGKQQLPATIVNLPFYKR